MTKQTEFWIARRPESIGWSYMGWIWDEENPNADFHVLTIEEHKRRVSGLEKEIERLKELCK